MKTYVLLAGLIALVPQVDSQGRIVAVTALILNAGDEIHSEYPHQFLLTVFGNKDGNDGAYWENPKSTSLTASSGTIHIDDPSERILDFGRLLPKGESLRAECIDGDVKTKCLRPDGKPALAGRLTLKGAWTIRPVEIDFDYYPRPDELDLSTFGFISKVAPRVSPLETILGGGVLLETKEAVTLTVDGKSASVTKILNCSGYYLGGSACSFLRVSNLPKSGLPGPKCGQRRGEVDAHFELIYEIFDSKPTYRYVPFSRLEDVEACRRFLQRSGAGDYPPRIKCPTPLLSPIAGK